MGNLLKKANVPQPQIDVLVARDQQITQLILNTIEEKFATKHDFAFVHKDIALLKIIDKRTKSLIWTGRILVFIIGTSQVLKLFGF